MNILVLYEKPPLYQGMKGFYVGFYTDRETMERVNPTLTFTWYDKPYHGGIKYLGTAVGKDRKQYEIFVREMDKPAL